MKLKPTPTSPQYQNAQHELEALYTGGNLKKIDRPPQNRLRFLLVILVALLFGVGGGILSVLVINTYFPELAYSGQLAVNTSTAVNAHAVVQNSSLNEQQLSKIHQAAAPSIVMILAKKTAPQEEIYYPNDIKGQGVVLTADGWIITVQGVIEGNQDNVVFTSDRRLYAVTKKVVDPSSNLVFLKTDATNLPVAQFVDASTLNAGQPVFTFGGDLDSAIWHLVSTEIESLRFYPDVLGNPLESSEYLNERLLLQVHLEKNYQGSPVVDSNGKLIGLNAVIQSSDTYCDSVIPIHDLDGVMGGLLKNQKVERALLGVHYFDLSRIVQVSLRQNQGVDQGILISGDSQNPAVIPGSPAEKAGLVAGDIITKLNDSEIDKDTDFSFLLQGLKPGEQITLTVLHNNQEKQVKIILDTVTASP